MTEEEYFRKNYPDSCYGDKPLSPHWDFFQDGVEFGEQQSEKCIAELEEKLKHAEENCINKTCIVFKDKEDCVAKLLELEAQLEREKNLNQCLSDHNEQLRELIEKMKCCSNCKHSRTEYEHCKTDKHEKWEIKENDKKRNT